MIGQALEIPFGEFEGTSAVKLSQEAQNSDKMQIVRPETCVCQKISVPLRLQSTARIEDPIEISTYIAAKRAQVTDNSIFYHMRENLIQKGINDGLISFNEQQTRVRYLLQNKERNYTDPEEIVQVETYLSLVYIYNYLPKRIKMFVPVTMGREVKEADIIVYGDDACLKPYILVECKKEEVSDAEFVQAIEQAYSYAYALPGEIKYVWVTSSILQEYFEVDKQQNTRTKLPDIPQAGVKELASYKYVYGAEYMEQKEGKQRFFPLSIIDQAELTKRFKQAHQALWGGGELNQSEAFDELDKLIFCKILDERKDRIMGEPYDFQIITISKETERDATKRREQESEALKTRILNLYAEGKRRDKEVFTDDIRLSAERIRTVVGYLEGVNLNETDLDSKGRAFETFMGGFFRGDFGQFFTPRPIVQFIVEALPITNQSKVLDTSCGSGGFLLYALNQVRNQATKLYPNYKNNVRQYDRWYKFWHDFASNNLFGIEINKQISRTAKMNMIIHDDGHTNVITSDGLVSAETIKERTGNNGFEYGTFDFIITNPPFGSAIKQAEHAYLKYYNLGKKEEDWLALKAVPEQVRDNQNTEVLFLEQDYKFLKEGGMLAIVLPDGILTNSTMQYVRTQLEDWFRIVAVVSMPQTAFSANGAGVKSSVLFLKKWDKTHSKKLADQKRTIEQRLLTNAKYRATRDLWDSEIKQKQKEKIEALKTKELRTATLVKQSNAYKEWNAELLAEYTNKVDELKSKLVEEYQQAKQRELPDYPIFMAIAEEIGYDATGKKTAVNELDAIGEELKKFINSL